VDINIHWEAAADGGTTFIFRHNGAPLSPQDLAALLSGGSNKDDKSQETVGRFGWPASLAALYCQPVSLLNCKTGLAVV
jgi:hypothetical protein